VADLIAILPARDKDRGRRGQILLITALVLGVAFVALAVILNSAIFTENLASRGDTTGADDVVTYQSNVEDGVAAIVRYETENASTSDDHGAVFSRVKVGVADADEIFLRRHARRGAVSNASILDQANGSRIFQTDSTRAFTDGNGNPDWDVATGVGQTRAFHMNVSRATLPTCGLFNDCFTMNVTDGSDLWQLSVTDSATGVEVSVDDGTGPVSCDKVNEPFVSINVTAGTVSGEPCSALDPADWPGSYDTIEYDNGDDVTGSYSLVVDAEGIADSPPGHFGAGPEPSVTPALYRMTIGYEYQTANLLVSQELRIAPGEPDG